MPLPKIRFSSLPRPVWEHILARVEERQISLEDLRRLQEWVNAAPWAPEGDWYKDFGSFIDQGLRRVSEDCADQGHGSVRNSNRVGSMPERTRFPSRHAAAGRAARQPVPGNM